MQKYFIMRTTKTWLCLFAIGLSLMLAACGGTTTNANSGSTPTATPTSITAAAPNATTVPAAAPNAITAPTAAPTTAPTMAPSSGNNISSSVVVSVGKVLSHQAVGSEITVLTTIKGFTFYVHEWQGASGFSCDGSCAETWKPLVYNGTGTPTSPTKLPGKLSIGTDAQGQKVVFYQGYPLYTYVGDKKPGDFNAPLADNSPWQLATLDLPTGL